MEEIVILNYQDFSILPLAHCCELQTQLEIARNISYLNPDLFTKIYEDSREVEIMLSSLNKKIKVKN